MDNKMTAEQALESIEYAAHCAEQSGLIDCPERIRDAIPVLRAEVEALKEENQRLTEVMLTGVTPDTVNGGMVLGLEGGMLQLMADCFAETFKGHGAKNFLSMDFTDKDGDSYTVTMQKAYAETPAEKNAKLEAEVEALRKDAERLDWLDKNVTRVSDSERYLSRSVYWGGGTNKDVREAIDAARLREGG